MLGGEALSGALVSRIQRAIPGIEVVNMYGPTETCIDATYHLAIPADLSASVLPIGKPLSNYQTYVLGADFQPVGVGVSGELYIGGAGLAQGYVNAAELTVQRFVPDPFSPQSGARMYRTGDRARWRSDGSIEFLGRVDQQLKIRGFRVEPAEIEAALTRHPAVAQSVVLSRPINTGGPARLVAWFVPHSDVPVPEATALRAHLAETLPDYMVPSAFVAIAEIPINRNGKLDANALPSQELGEAEYVEPRTDTEKRIAGLFAEVLGLDRCGATDHFFELGGHSLLSEYSAPRDLRLADRCATGRATRFVASGYQTIQNDRRSIPPRRNTALVSAGTHLVRRSAAAGFELQHSDRL
jgi:acyl-coenzyme A synthetase/AMP-(fatty) acid ligase